MTDAEKKERARRSRYEKKMRQELKDKLSALCNTANSALHYLAIGDEINLKIVLQYLFGDLESYNGSGYAHNADSSARQWIIALKQKEAAKGAKA